MADQEVERRDSSSSGDMTDQEVQRRDEVTGSNEKRIIDSWVFPTFLLVMTVLCIAIGVGFARWVENSNTDTSVKKSNMDMINGFFERLRN